MSGGSENVVSVSQRVFKDVFSKAEVNVDIYHVDEHNDGSFYGCNITVPLSAIVQCAHHFNGLFSNGNGACYHEIAGLNQDVGWADVLRYAVLPYERLRLLGQPVLPLDLENRCVFEVLSLVNDGEEVVIDCMVYPCDGPLWDGD